MSYIITLNNINDSDLPKVGYRALDFAKIYQAKYNTSLSFVVPNALFEEFLLQTKAGINIRAAFQKLNYENDESLKLANIAIKKVFEEAEFPQDLLDELREAYDSLAVGMDRSSASDLLNENEAKVNLIASPDYLKGTEDMNGIIMNLKGFDNFLVGLKSAWLSLYSPEAMVWRNKKGIDDFNAGVIVQRFMKPDATAETYSKGPLGDYEIIVKAYFGLPDILFGASKDVFSISKEYLTIETHKAARQEYKISWGDDNKIVKVDLGTHGDERKISDKDAIEVARLTKRIKTLGDFNFKAFFFFRKGTPYVFFISRFLEEAVQPLDAEPLTVEEAAEEPKEVIPEEEPPEEPIEEAPEEVYVEETKEDVQEESSEEEKHEEVEPEEEDTEEIGEESGEQEEFVDDDDFILKEDKK